MKKIEGLKPFGRFIMTIGQLPASYVVSMTYEEQLIWLCNYLQNTVIPTVNNNGEAVEELQNLFIELQEYVDNYFENLDIQEEVNNKLDEMAESGELENIIAQYLTLTTLFVYNTIQDMSDATNLSEGTSAYCLGQDTYNDGKGAFYKIRTITSGDTIDGFNIVALESGNTIIGERLPNYYINQINNVTIPAIQSDINTINNTTIPALSDRVTTIENELLPKPRKIVMFGDSYARGSTGTELIDSWCKRVATMMGMQNDYYSLGVSGGAFYNGTLNAGFPDLVALVPQAERQYVEKVIVGAGANDFVVSGSQTNIGTNVLSLVDDIKAAFPNAKIYFCFIGYKNIMNDTFASVRATLRDVIEKYASCISKGCLFAGNIGYILHNRDYISATDGTHPNNDGYNEISKAIYNFVEGGKAFVRPQIVGYSITPGTNFTINQSNTLSLNDEVTLWNSAEFTVTGSSAFGTNNVGVVQIGDFVNPQFFRPNSSTTLIASGTALVTFSDNSQQNLEISLRMGYTGQAYLIFDKQYANIVSVRSRALHGSVPTLTY